MTAKNLRVLLVESSDQDSNGLLSKLTDAGYALEHRRAQDAASMRQALRQHTFDVILCSDDPGSFGGLGAYHLLRQLDLDMFKAMNDAGGTNPSYPWVEAAVRLMRPAVGVIVLGTWAYLKVNSIDSESVDNFAGAVGFYLFGDRTLFYARKTK